MFAVDVFDLITFSGESTISRSIVVAVFSVIRVGPVGRIVRLNVEFMRFSAVRFNDGWEDLTLMLKSPTMNSLSNPKSSKSIRTFS